MKTTRIFLLFLLPIAACKKDKKETPAPVVNCNIIVEKNYDNNVSVFEYDSQDRIVKETVNGTGTTTVEYKDNGKTVIETGTNSIFTFKLNSQGQTISKEQSSNNGTYSKSVYTYDQNNYITRVISENSDNQSPDVDRDTIIYTNYTANGNLTKTVLTQPTGNEMVTFNFTHDLSKPNNIPVIYSYSRSFTNNEHDKNLIKTASQYANSSNYSVDYTYEYDSKGRVTKQIGTYVLNGAPGTETTTYKYRCD